MRDKKRYTAAKNRWNKKTYEFLKAVVRREKASIFKEKIKSQGLTVSGFFNHAIDEFLS